MMTAQTRRIEETLRRTESHLTELLNNMPSGVTVYEPVGRGSDFVIQSMNKAGEGMDGLRREDIVGRRLSRAFPEAEKMGLLKVLRRVRRTGRPERLPAAYYAGGNNPGWRENYVYKLPSGEVVSVYRDVTESVRAQEFERALIQAQRLASVGQLAAGVAHEINNPLSALSGEIQWLKRKSRSPRVQKSLEFMDRVSRRIAETVTHLLTFSRQAPQDARRPASLNALVERTLALVERRLQAQKVRMVKRLGRRLPAVRVNCGQIEQVFMNVLSNSLDAMPRGGRLSIETRRDASRRAVTVVVQDTGCGIPAADLPRVFDPFFTTKLPGKGVGLGLSVSHGIVTGHGGRIEVSSERGCGAKVLIELPVSFKNV